MDDAKIYFHANNIYEKKVPNYFYYWILLHIIFLFFVIVFLAFYQIEIKTSYGGIYENNKIHIVVDSKFFQLKTDKVFIQDKQYQYQVNKIEVIAYEEGKANLWEVWISLDLPNNWKIENNQFQLSFIREKTTILKQIIRNIKKGMNL